jgi:Uncharacterized conserved protein
MGGQLWEMTSRELTLPQLEKLNRDRKTTERGFWQKLRRHARQLPFADELLAGYYCAVDPATPLRARAVLYGAIAYFVLPFDIVPDWIVGLGFTDDAAVLAARSAASSPISKTPTATGPGRCWRGFRASSPWAKQTLFCRHGRAKSRP